MEPAADVVGRTLGEFTLKEKIGQGAFGAVYRAVQSSLGREAVVKILQPKSGGVAGTAKVRFLREARLASRLDHPFAAHIYAFGAEDDGTLWIAMELVRGTSLADLLRVQGPIPVDRAIPLLERICEVVENAHEHGIVHRDLKPANIMIITRGGRLFPKLLDLGLAKIIEGPEAVPRAASAPAAPSDGVGIADTMADADDGARVTQRGATIGTPLYMAPEQWTQLPVDARADQYALGCVAYECLVGKPPFLGRSIIEVAKAHQTAPLPPLPPSLPEKMAEVLARAVAKKASDRWGSVLRFATALRDAAGLGAESLLPEVDEALRRVAQDAPAPIAEAAAGIEAARNPHEARDAVLRTVRVTLRWLAIIGLAGRTRGGIEAAGAGQVVVDLLRELRKRELDEGDWVTLVEALVKPYAEHPELHAIPELVRASAAGIPARLAKIGEDVAPARDALAQAYAALSMALRDMTFLRDYPLVVPRGSVAEMWMGARRASRPSVELAAAVPDGEGRPVLADADRRPVLVLWPLAQIASPSPGAPEEIFLVDGHGRRGARLVGGAVGFERQDEGVWDYFRQSILDESLTDSGPRLEVAPYRGLAPFTAEDARSFYGREREAESFANRLKVQSLLVVAGPSGVGKSSFVQAGVAPSLPEGSQVVVVRPGPTPLATLEGRLDGQDPALLVVDQFEELFTLCADPAEREAFAGRLVALTRGQARVVLTVRDDFLARAAELPSLRDRVTQGLHLVTTPAPDDLLRILLEPARRAGYEFDPRELPDKMVAEVAGRPGALALLSFTASKLWDARDRHFHRLTGAAYDAMGGVGGALARHADETLAQLPAAEQRLVREAFRHLVTAEGTRAVLTPSELRQLLGGGPAAERAIETLIGARLLVSDEERIEIIHEALVVAWPRLVEWRHEDAEGSRFRDQLRTAVKAWSERGRPGGLLWRDDALADYQRWRAAHQGPLTDAEEAFAGASLTDARQTRRNRRVLLGVALVVLTAAVIVLLFLNRRAEKSEARAQSNAAESRDRLLDSYEEQGRQYFLSGDTQRALPFLVEAWKEGRHGEGVGYLLARALRARDSQLQLFRHDADVWTMRFDREGKRVASGDFSGRVRVWDVESGARLFDVAAHEGYAFGVEFSPDGARLATAGIDKRARVWDLATGRKLLELAHEDRVYRAAFSPDGRLIVTASWDRTARLWDAQTGAEIARLPHDAKLDLASFSRDGTEVLTGGHDGRALLWDVRTHQLVRAFPGAIGRLQVAKLSAASDLVLTLAQGGRVAEVWDAKTGARLAELGHDQGVSFGDLSDDGELAVTGSADRTVRVWEPRSGKLLGTIFGDSGIRRVKLCAGHEVIVADMDNGVIRTWRARNGMPLDRYEGHLDRTWTMDCPAQGRPDIFGTAGFDETVRIWTASASQRQAELPMGAEEISAFDMTPDGDRWVTTAGEARVWRRGRPQDVEVRGTEGDATIGARLDPRGRLLVTALKNPPVARLWAVGGSPTPVTLEGHEAPITRIAFSPDGSLVATASQDGTARLWSTATGRSLHTLVGHTGPVWSVEFSPDGSLVVTGGTDRTTRIWNSSTGDLVRQLAGHTGPVLRAVFDPAGRRLATAGSDSTVRLWALDGTALRVMEGQAEEIPALAFHEGLIASGSQDGAVVIWEADTGRLLQQIRALPEPILGVVFVDGGKSLVIATRHSLDRWDTSSYVSGDATPEIDCRTQFGLVDGQIVRRHSDNKDCAMKHIPYIP